MEDGLLLKPTWPAMSLDSTFTQRAFGEEGPKGQLWTGYTAYKQSLVLSECISDSFVYTLALFIIADLVFRFGCYNYGRIQFNYH